MTGKGLKLVECIFKRFRKWILNGREQPSFVLSSVGLCSGLFMHFASIFVFWSVCLFVCLYNRLLMSLYTLTCSITIGLCYIKLMCSVLFFVFVENLHLRMFVANVCVCVCGWVWVCVCQYLNLPERVKLMNVYFCKRLNLKSGIVYANFVNISICASFNCYKFEYISLS